MWSTRAAISERTHIPIAGLGPGCGKVSPEGLEPCRALHGLRLVNRPDNAAKRIREIIQTALTRRVLANDLSANCVIVRYCHFSSSLGDSRCRPRRSWFDLSMNPRNASRRQLRTY